ncbi:glutathionyl-hydroquinone reductase YqjG-like isoform X1, variant 2 [Balamuthia mandrillaris]
MASSSSTIPGGAATDGSPNNVARSKTSFDEVDKTTGEFKRQPTTFRHWVKLDGSTEFPPEAGRYHLYVSYACPWASRCLLFRSLKGLEEAIPVHTVAPRWGLVNKETGAHGWVFTSKEEGETSSDVIGGISCVDELNHCKTLRELYELAVPDYNGKYTVPVLWDSKTKTIVNNESSEIIQMFNREFNSMAKNAELDLCPPELENYIKELNDWMYDTINNGVYRCGFATTQEAYESAFKTLFEKLDEAEAKLGTSRYLCGNTITG